MRLRRFAALGLLVVGCSSDDVSSDSGSNTEPLKCESAPGYGSAHAPRRVGAVSAALVDTSGSPINDLVVQVCGLDVCIDGRMQANGKTSISVQQPVTKPAFKYGTGTDFARLAFLLPEAEDSELGTLTAITLPAFAEGAALVAGKSATSGGVTLTLDARAQIDVDSLVYPEPAEQTFRVARILPEHQVPAVDKTLGLELVYAAAPVETEFCPPAKLSVVNELGWAPGTEVEIFVHGVNVDEAWAPYAGWAKATEGVVTADGTRIETPNGGLRMLSTFGLRKKS